MKSKGTQSNKNTQRKPAAILCADVVGYSRLMGADGEVTPGRLCARAGSFLSMRALLAVLLILAAGQVHGTPIPIIDAHSQVDHTVDLAKVIRLMDKGGISRVILSARGRLKPRQLIEFAARNPGRVTAAVRTKGKIYVENDPRYYQLLRKQLAMPEFGAMAEVILWHAKKGNKAPQWVVPIAAAQVQAPLNAALERGWPFLAHIEFAAAGSDRIAYMADLEKMLNDYPAHPIGLIHMGQLPPREVRRLIEKHANVFFLTSHANTIVVSKSRQPWINMFDGRKLKPAWKDLIVRYPDRFVMAYDNVFAEHWGRYYLKQIALWRKALADLPHDVAHAVAHGNAERLWRLPPATR